MAAARWRTAPLEAKSSVRPACKTSPLISRSDSEFSEGAFVALGKLGSGVVNRFRVGLACPQQPFHVSSTFGLISGLLSTATDRSFKVGGSRVPLEAPVSATFSNNLLGLRGVVLMKSKALCLKLLSYLPDVAVRRNGPGLPG